MIKVRLAILLLISVAAGLCQPALAKDPAFSFAVLANAFRYGPDERALRQALTSAAADNVAFVVANGIKAANEPCSDELYLHRKSLYEKPKTSVVLSLAANDWAECRRSNGESAAVERLLKVRETFFTDDPYSEDDNIPLVRQSTMEKFRSYSENVRWERDGVLFATLNLPANNNHYLSAAGRNNEFEDRLVANQEWLERLFALAKIRKAPGIVIFSDANPLAKPAAKGGRRDKRRDGFAEIRRHLLQLSSEFSGKVLVIHNGKPSEWASLHKISWRGNLGEIGMLTGWAKINVDPARGPVFSADLQPPEN